MRIKDLKDTKEIVAGDNAILHELLNPHNEETDARYSVAHATVHVGEETAPHLMKTSEVYYILSGAGEMVVGEESHAVHTGQLIDIPAGATQYIKNTDPNADLEFLCIVDPAWKAEDEVIL